MSTRIDIAINESGASSLTRALEGIAASCQRLSPTLAAKLRGQALRVGLNTDKLVKQVAIAALDTVVHKTPHATGKARRNWQVAINTRGSITKPLEETDYDGDSTVAEGALKILTTARRPGQTIYISNVLPYIQRLNEGWSQQAPAGFVEMSVQSASKRAAGGKIL